MRDDTRIDYHERMLRVLLHIQTHLDEDLSLDTLAKVAFFSPFHFHRLFRAMVGESASEYVRRLRLERAAHQLSFSRRAVIAVALDAGYDSHESFTRAFRGLFDCSPSEYRKKRRGWMASVASRQSVIPPWERNKMNNVINGDNLMEVRLEKRQPMRVAFARHIGPYKDCGKAWESICKFAGQNGLMSADTMWIGISHDHPDVTAPEKLRYDACLPVGENVVATGDIGIQEIAGGEYAVMTHRGPYENLNNTYRWFFGEWLPASGRELGNSPGFEVYRNSPDSTAPEQLLTDIYILLGS
jgi:AraC family transcriptional regulator